METKTRVWLERAAFVLLGILIAVAFNTYQTRTPVLHSVGALIAPR